MKFSHKDTILIKNLSVKGYGAWKLLSEFPDKGSKLGSIIKMFNKNYFAIYYT